MSRSIMAVCAKDKEFGDEKERERKRESYLIDKGCRGGRERVLKEQLSFRLTPLDSVGSPEHPKKSTL